MGCGCGKSPCCCGPTNTANAAAARTARNSYDPSCYADPDASCYHESLAQSFVGLANCLRNILTESGLRHYRVSILHLRYPSGEQRFHGEPYVERTIPILPTPRVEGLEGLDEAVMSVGTQEVGTVTVSKINADLSEEDLRGFERHQHDYQPTQVVFWEIEFYGNRGDTVRRRFQLAGAPRRTMLGWQVRLQRAQDDRSLTGQVQLPD